MLMKTNFNIIKEDLIHIKTNKEMQLKKLSRKRS
jgi:hypothetical protein